ncbi:MAG TPA: hypothetical protein ENO17_05785 [Candidatus Atribacteria bacterium]|nr:hypothetical protein [Candidatus Atribacteria bacterium]
MSKNSENKDQDIKIVELCRVPREDEALAIESLLASFNIRCILQSDITRSVYPFTMDGLAEVSILVSEKDLKKSREIINKNI